MGNCVAKTRRFSMHVMEAKTNVSPFSELIGYRNVDEAVRALRVLQERLEAEDPDCCNDASLTEVLVDLLSATSPTLMTETLRTIQLVLEHEPEEAPLGPSFLDCGLLPRIRAAVDAGSDAPGLVLAAFACAEAVLIESRGSALAKVIEAKMIEAALNTATSDTRNFDAIQARLAALEFLLAAAQRVPPALKTYFGAASFVDPIVGLSEQSSSESVAVIKPAIKILRALERKGVLTTEKLAELLPQTDDCCSVNSVETPKNVEHENNEINEGDKNHNFDIDKESESHICHDDNADSDYENN